MIIDDRGSVISLATRPGYRRFFLIVSTVSIRSSDSFELFRLMIGDRDPSSLSPLDRGTVTVDSGGWSTSPTQSHHGLIGIVELNVKVVPVVASGVVKMNVNV